MIINKTNLRQSGSLSYGNYPTKIIYHHPEFNGTIEALNDVMINDGFSMIGYNFYVRKDGSVWEGRPTDVIGANCYGQNASSIGIAFEGNFMTDTMSDGQFNAGVELSKYLVQQNSSISEIGPHNKYWNTDCPGVNFPVDKMIMAAIGGGAVNVTTSETAITSNSNTNYLKLWDSGDAVKQLQQKLIQLGYDLGTSGADGIFGQYTFNAIEHFQAKVSLTTDGIAGPQTLAAIDLALNKPPTFDIKYLQHQLNVQFNAGLEEDNSAGAKTLGALANITVKIGASGNITKWIQGKLGVNVDGGFGYKTMTAVQNFQAKNGLGADGVVGINTWSKLLGL